MCWLDQWLCTLGSQCCWALPSRCCGHRRLPWRSLRAFPRVHTHLPSICPPRSRVMLKVSGEALEGQQGFGIDPQVLQVGKGAGHSIICGYLRPAWGRRAYCAGLALPYKLLVSLPARHVVQPKHAGTCCMQRCACPATCPSAAPAF